MKTLLSAAALTSLLLAAGAGSPAAATEDHRREAPLGGTQWVPEQIYDEPAPLRYVNDEDDDDDDDDDDNDRRHRRHYGQWPYPQPVPYPYDPWPNYGQGWNNPWWQHHNPHYGSYQPLPKHVIVYKLQRRHFYNIQKIKAKKGYYKVYAFDRYGRPVSVIVDPYTGRILSVGPR
jgi:hypothetical protein